MLRFTFQELETHGGASDPHRQTYVLCSAGKALRALQDLDRFCLGAGGHGGGRLGSSGRLRQSVSHPGQRQTQASAADPLPAHLGRALLSLGAAGGREKGRGAPNFQSRLRKARLSRRPSIAASSPGPRGRLQEREPFRVRGAAARSGSPTGMIGLACLGSESTSPRADPGKGSANLLREAPPLFKKYCRETRPNFCPSGSVPSLPADDRSKRLRARGPRRRLHRFSLTGSRAAAPRGKRTPALPWRPRSHRRLHPLPFSA